MNEENILEYIRNCNDTQSIIRIKRALGTQQRKLTRRKASQRELDV